MWTFTASVVKGFWSYFWTNDRFLWLKMGKWWNCNFINVSLILKDSWILCVVIFQGDACISCASVGAAVGDGVAVPGPRGERGDPGPPGEGKPGRNVSISCICSFVIYFSVLRELLLIILHVFVLGKTRLTRCAGTCRPQRKQGLNVHSLCFHVYKYTQRIHRQILICIILCLL